MADVTISSDFNKIFTDLEKLFKSELNAKVGLDELTKATVRFNKAQQEQLGGVSSVALAFKEQGKQADNTAKKVGKLNTVLGRIGSSAVGFALSQVFFTLTSSVRTATDEVIKFEKAVAEVQTIDVANLGYGEWAKQLRELSDEFGTDILDQAEGAYQTLSNQVAQGSQATEFLTSSNRLAAASVSSTSDAVEILTSTINAYSDDAGSAEEISAKLFKTVELGRVRINELSKDFGRVAVPAAKLGISLDELLAALSTITRQGVPANEALTFLRGIIQKLIRPTEEMKGLFKDLEVTSGEAAIQTKTFAGFLAELEERTQGSSTEIGGLFNRVRAGTGVLALMGDQLRQFNRDLGDIEESGDSFNRAVNIILEGPGKKLEIELNKIKNFFTKDIFDNLLRSIADLTGGFEGFADTFKTVFSNASIIAVAALTVKIGFLATSVTALSAATVAASATFLGLTGVVVAAILVYQKFGESARQLTSVVEQETRDYIKSLEERNKEEKDLLKESLDAIDEHIRGVSIAFDSINSRLTETFAQERADDVEIFKDFQKSIKETAADAVKNIKDGNKELQKDYKELAKAAKDQFNVIRSLKASGEDKLFDLQVEKFAGDPLSQLKLITGEINNIKKLRLQAVESGDIKGFDDLTNRINELSDSFVSITRESAGFQSGISSVRNLKIINLEQGFRGKNIAEEQKLRAQIALRFQSEADSAEEKLTVREFELQQIESINSKLGESFDLEKATTDQIVKRIQLLNELQYRLAGNGIELLRTTSFADGTVSAPTDQLEQQMINLESVLSSERERVIVEEKAEEVLKRRRALQNEVNASKSEEARLNRQNLDFQGRIAKLGFQSALRRNTDGDLTDILPGRGKDAEAVFKEAFTSFGVFNQRDNGATAQDVDSFNRSLLAVQNALENGTVNQGQQLQISQEFLKNSLNLLDKAADVSPFSAEGQLIEELKEITSVITGLTKGEVQKLTDVLRKGITFKRTPTDEDIDFFRNAGGVDVQGFIERGISVTRNYGLSEINTEDTALNALESGRAIFTRIEELEAQRENIKNIQETLKTSNEQLKELGLTTEQQFSILNDTVGESVTTVQAFTDAMKNFLDATFDRRDNGGIRPQGRASGGRVFDLRRQGNDNIPIMAQPGEIVLNRNSSRRLASNLLAANTNRLSLGLQQQAQALNIQNTFNLPAGGGHDARQLSKTIMAQMKRGLRKGLYKL